MSAVRVSGLEFGYGARRVLDGLSFQLDYARAVCVLGPNGVGKSTLFKCLLGLAHGFKGDISVAGLDVARARPHELARHMAFVPQSHSPAFGCGVLEMVMMGANAGRLRNPGTAEREYARSMLAQLGIADLACRDYARLSGGERQLVLIARALAQGARVLIMDEPVANLDYGNQLRVMEHVCALSRQGMLVIMSTHQPDHALTYADEILALHSGKLICQGPPNIVITPELMRQLYNVNIQIHQIPGTTRYTCTPI